MKIIALEIDGFGVWNGLKVEHLAEGINVFYGPNEAGKTTLLQFIRSMLYGCSSQRQRYWLPVHGGRPGGSIEVAGPNGQFQIARHHDHTAEGCASEQITLTAPDGTRQGEHFLRVLLCNVDEAIFNNVFAVGLREIQELGTLGDTEAAELLYSLTAGLDRVSLVEVMRELEASRNRVLDADGKPCQIVQLLAEREALRSEIEELGSLSRNYAHLAAERGEVDRDVGRLQEEVNRAEQQIAVLDVVVAMRERWAQRASLDEQLSSLGTLKPMPANAVERLDAIHVKLERHQQRVQQLATQREELKREFAGLAVNEPLWRQAGRIEAFGEQESWIAQLQSQVAEVAAEVAELQSQLSEETERLGLGAQANALPTFTTKTLASLRSPGKSLRHSRQQRAEALDAVAKAKELAESLAHQIASTLAARGEKDLAGAMDHAGNLVLQLRRHMQIDERLEQLARYQTELEQRSRQLVDRQLLPLWVWAALGGVFVVGGVSIMAGVFMPASIVGPMGWALGVLGFVGTGSSLLGKVVFERSNARQLDACQKQLAMLQLQVQQAKEDRDRLDGQLPSSGGQISNKLQAAEQDLAFLEELTPLDTRRNAAQQEAAAAAKTLAQAEEDAKAAARRWRHAVASVGLPDNITTNQVRRLMQRCGRIADVQRRLAQRREDLSHRQRERDALSARIVQLASDGGVSLTGKNPIEHLHQLTEAIDRQQAAVARRDAIRRQARKIRADQSKHADALSRWKHRRRELLFEAGADDEREFRERAVRFARAEVLRRDRDSLAREIQAAIASHCSEDVLRQQVEDSAVPAETRRDDLRQRLALLHQQLHGRLEKRGQLVEQINVLTSDRRSAVKHLELGIVEKRLEDAARRWQVLAVTCRVLEMIRTSYEQHRQPETLREASGYLDRLTHGRYHRVWTPLGEKTLRVDDAEGNSLPVEALSRGTREQLFLSLRLALATCYARRGASLPLVLDDVLVNFDAERAKAAAVVLRDFAAAGHQLLVFTCHEHILRLFKALKLPISQLPDNAGAGPHLIRVEQRGEERTKPSKESATPRRKRAERPKERPYEEEPMADETEEDEPADDDNSGDSRWEEFEEADAFEDGESDEPNDGSAEAA